MSMCVVLGFLVSCCFLLLLSAANEMGYNGDCPQFFHCGNIGDAIHFPFTNTNRSACGLPIWGCGDEYGDQQIKLGNKKWYTIKSIAEDNSFSVIDQEFGDHFCSENSSVFNYNASLPQASPIMSFQIDMEHNTTLFRCKHEDIDGVPEQYVHLAHCYNYRIYSCPPPPPPPLRKHDKFNCPLPASSCSVFHLPVRPLFPPNPGHAEFTIKVVLSEDCSRCYSRRGQCRLDGKGEFHCAIAKDKKPVWKVILGSTIGCAFALFVILLLYKRRCTSEFKHQSGCHADPYSNPDPESGSVFFGVPVFSYKELEEATNNFHHSRELGNGGFGRVYYGKLRDEREVAVKRLYEQNFRRVEQFMNEIEILTRLRHRNLVSLYGCTSRHSCELMLVYEFVPNGTVACHLHGHLEKPGSMPWSIRMKIAIETAGALTYLHASDIIHRDVKTNNILLDNSFTVKVADFGLSRLFPNDVTHVSTAPQGTPGYVDPEYDQFYQLTSKSDVYSFGVVLIELISSMPVVDITRHRDEINLADLAIKMIKNCSFKELVDPSLGFESDNEVKRMIISVAELAFQCLERDKALRPSMDRVLEVLKKIESGKDEPEHLEEADVNVSEMSNNNVHPSPPTSPNCDEVGLLKMSG